MVLGAWSTYALLVDSTPLDLAIVSACCFFEGQDKFNNVPTDYGTSFMLCQNVPISYFRGWRHAVISSHLFVLIISSSHVTDAR